MTLNINGLYYSIYITKRPRTLNELKNKTNVILPVKDSPYLRTHTESEKMEKNIQSK